MNCVFQLCIFFFFPLVWSNKCKTNIFAIDYLFEGGPVSGYWLTSEPFFSCRSRAWLYSGWLKHSSSTPIPLLFSLSCLNKEQCHLFSLTNENLFCCFFCLSGFSLENIPVMEVVCFWMHLILGGCLCVSGVLPCPRQPDSQWCLPDSQPKWPQLLFSFFLFTAFSPLKNSSV